MAVRINVSAMFLAYFVCVLHLGVSQLIDGTQPQQIHLSATGDPTEMMVTWSTFSSAASAVEFGVGNFSEAAYGKSTMFVDGGSLKHTQFIHRVLLTGLQPGTKYMYHCGSPKGWSDVFWFRTFVEGNDWSPRFAVYGDMGNQNAQSLGRLQEETQMNMYDAILHVGDFAYDMYEDNANRGDEFMRQIESIAAYVPYMTCPGNHEQMYNFSNYKNRFTMPNYENTQNLWYSWNVGAVHILSFSTEVYFYTAYGKELIKQQMDWIHTDLQKASDPVNRAKQPWIITMGHRPSYCTESDHDDCTTYESEIRNAFESIFYNYGVDVEIWAHEHIYERLWPVYNKTVYNGSMEHPYTNPKAPIHIITGSAGCRERHDGFGPKRPWSAFRSADYGYTRMHVWNTTHINFQQVSDDKNGKVIDEFTLIKDKHGPEAWL